MCRGEGVVRVCVCLCVCTCKRVCVCKCVGARGVVAEVGDVEVGALEWRDG